MNIYAQGCKKRCPGCQNVDCQNFTGGAKLYISDLDNVAKEYSLSKWVCWLGGDAIYQPEAFKIFNTEFASRGYRIALYTGGIFEDIQSLLANVNLVIDGEWQGKTVQDSGTNQTIWYRKFLGDEWSLIGDWGTLTTLLTTKIKIG